jgi:hypothetical protein
MTYETEDDFDHEDKSATNSTTDPVVLLERREIAAEYKTHALEALGVKSAGSSERSVVIVSFPA